MKFLILTSIAILSMIGIVGIQDADATAPCYSPTGQEIYDDNDLIYIANTTLIEINDDDATVWFETISIIKGNPVSVQNTTLPVESTNLDFYVRGADYYEVGSNVFFAEYFDKNGLTSSHYCHMGDGVRIPYRHVNYDGTKLIHTTYDRLMTYLNSQYDLLSNIQTIKHTDVPPQFSLKQFDNNFSHLDEIRCKIGFTLLLKNNLQPSCVSSETAEILIKRNWGNPLVMFPFFNNPENLKSTLESTNLSYENKFWIRLSIGSTYESWTDDPLWNQSDEYEHVQKQQNAKIHPHDSNYDLNRVSQFFMNYDVPVYEIFLVLNDKSDCPFPWCGQNDRFYILTTMN